MSEKTLKELVIDLLVAKQVEEDARAKRILAEDEISKLIPGPDKGQKTVTIDEFKVTVERGFNYKAKCQEILEFWPKNDSLPPPIKSKTSWEIDEKGYEYYREQVPVMFDKHLRDAVTVTPKKTSITVTQKAK